MKNLLHQYFRWALVMLVITPWKANTIQVVLESDLIAELAKGVLDACVS
jgi:hypothetical protein